MIKSDYGVIVGRFQVPYLHDGHRNLLEIVDQNSKNMIVFIGVSPCRSTERNPLNFECRRDMIQNCFPKAIIVPINDVPTDEEWSKNLDKKINEIVDHGSVVLYGSRDSFIPYYHGSFPTCEIECIHDITGTEIRENCSKTRINSYDFRAGIIYGAYDKWPSPVVTIDVAIFNEDHTKILLGRKPNQDKFRLIGGFVDIDETFSQTVKREAKEETGAVLKNVKFVDSFVVDDWRYRSENNNIITVLHTAEVQSGDIKPGDDIIEVKWVDFSDDLLYIIVDEHKPLIHKLMNLGDSHEE